MCRLSILASTLYSAIMQQTHDKTNLQHDKTNLQSRPRRVLSWLFSLLLMCLPYTDAIKAATSLPQQMPCHQHAVADHHPHGSHCLFELGETGCHCCQLHAPPGIVAAPIPPIALNLRISTVPVARIHSLPRPPHLPLYRPPKQSAS